MRPDSSGPDLASAVLRRRFRGRDPRTALVYRNVLDYQSWPVLAGPMIVSRKPRLQPGSSRKIE
jgi:hypothetical protein